MGTFSLYVEDLARFVREDYDPDLVTGYNILNFDNVWPDHWGPDYVQQAALWRETLATLPPAVAHMIAHENAERLWRLAPVGGK